VAKSLQIYTSSSPPFWQRIEEEVHNVRSAELMLHNHRVVRHSCGVEEALKVIAEE
jgi:hypothetical protein